MHALGGINPESGFVSKSEIFHDSCTHSLLPLNCSCCNELFLSKLLLTLYLLSKFLLVIIFVYFFIECLLNFT